MDDDDIGQEGFGSFMDHMVPGVTSKVFNNAPKYLVDRYRSAVAALMDKARAVDPSNFEEKDDWYEALGSKLMNSKEMYEYKEATDSLMAILKVVVALEIVLTGEVSHEH